MNRRRPLSPLTRYPLRDRLKRLALAAELAFVAAHLGAADRDLSIQIECPASVRVGQHVKVRFTAIASGSDGFYFKQPWKWAVNGLRLVAEAADGSTHDSTTAIYDIDGSYLCTFFKPLSRGDRFSFEEMVVIGPTPVLDPAAHLPLDVFVEAALPHLDLGPGRYKLRWVYEPRLYPEEGKCAVADVPIWSGHVESVAIELDVK